MAWPSDLRTVNTDSDINTSELFFIKDSLENGDATVYDDSSFSESRTFKVKMPSGEKFRVGEFLEVVYYVGRVKEDKDG